MIVDPLVGNDAADKEDVDEAVAENRLEGRPARRVGDAACIDGDRQHAGGRETQRLELAAVELGIAEREIDVSDERRQLTSSERRQPEEARTNTGRRTPPA